MPWAVFRQENFSLGQFKGVEKISGEHMAELIKERPNAQAVHHCMQGCIVNCSNVYTDENGELIVSGLEYEDDRIDGVELYDR